MKKFGAGIGSASLILIFSVLCLTVFALLTLSESNREKALTEKFASSVENYYSADSAAVEVARKLHTAVDNGEILSEINNIPIYSDGNGTFSYFCPIDDNRSIAVKLRNVNGEFEIIAWNETDTENWVPDEQLNVWMGE